MSREEVGLAEDRKLSAVKSWFTRSVSFGGLNGSSTALSVAAACKGLSEGNHAPGNALPDQSEAWGGLNVNLKPLSMRLHYEEKVPDEWAGLTMHGHRDFMDASLCIHRRVKTFNESDRESPSMVPRNVTPLTPLTPLRWKSNPCDEEEGEPEEETKLVQEPKAVEQRSRLGLTVTTAEEHLPSAENVGEGEQDLDIVADGQVSPFEDAATESPSDQALKAASGDDVMTMTIDFLRARLLSERSASKVAKQQIRELGTKVTKLELELEHEVEKKKKAEKSAEEALLKLLTGNFSRVADCTAKTIHVNSGSGVSAGEEIKEELLESNASDISRTDSIGSSLGSKDSGDSKKKDNRAAIENRLRKMWSQMTTDVNALAEGGHQGEQLMSWMEKVPAFLQNTAGLQKSALEEMPLNSVNGRQQKKATYQQHRSTKAKHESESREYWQEKQLQQEDPPSSYRNRDAKGRAYDVAPTSRSAEDAFRHDRGGAHPMWDDRDGLDQTSKDIYYRQRERDEPHRRYRHGHRRSRSHDSSNWPDEEDYRLVDMPHQQRLSGEVYPGRRTHSRFDNREGRHESSNGMTRQTSLTSKTNGTSQHKPPLNEPVQASEPKLFLGYGPAFDAARDRDSSPPYQQGRVSNNNVTDLLLALRKAKASIQKSGSDRAPPIHPHRASWEPVKSKYSVDSQAQYHTRSMEHEMGAARMRPSNSSPSLNYNVRPADNGHSNFVDQLNVGNGIDFFF